MRVRQADTVRTDGHAADVAAPARRVSAAALGAPHGAGLLPSAVLALQQRVGNRATGRLLQARQQIDAPGDRHEREAERLAARALPAPAVDQPALPHGHPLDPALRRHFESRLGHDFAGVRLHASAEAAAANAALQARAFTQLDHIYLGRGPLDTRSPGGQHLLAHELVHVMQQSRPGGPRGHIQRLTDWSLTPAQVQAEPAPQPHELYTYQQIYDLKQRWEDAATLAACKLMPPCQERSDFLAEMQKRCKVMKLTPGTTPIDTLLDQGNVNPARLPHADPQTGQRLADVVSNRYQFELAMILRTCLEQRVTSPADRRYSRAEVMNEIKDAYVTSLNQGTRWDVIRREVGLSGQRRVVNTLTPVNADYDPAAFGNYMHTGWASMARNLPVDAGHGRTTNLWHSELTTANGTPIFEAFRSGSIGARGVGSRLDQEAFSEEKAHGLLQAMAIRRLRQEHPGRKQRLAGTFGIKEAPLQVDVVSISLQTRSPGMVAGKHIAPFDEQADVELQAQGLYAWHGKEETFRGLEGLPPRTVRYHVIFFATGVNAAADLLGRTQNETNRVAMAHFGQAYADWRATVSKHLQARSNDVQATRELRANLAMAAMLWHQIGGDAAWWQVPDWQWTPGFKDYRLPALIANLAYLMGHTVQYNCKSGKDRTSVMDIESKAMALRIGAWMETARTLDLPDRVVRDQPKFRSGDVPELYEFESPGDKQSYRALLVEAGNLELQKLNTGAMGYKIIPKAAAEKKVAARIGKVADLVLGLTRTVEVKGRYRDQDFY